MITIVKLDVSGKETWRYQGRILHQQGSRLILEAYFNREDMLFQGMPLCRGDRFVETYFTDRWYNIYEIHSRADDSLRGWYCNVSFPARLEGDKLFFTDLALDLLVFPDGRQIVLDEDEFNRLDLTPQVREQAISALRELQAVFKQPEVTEA
jgi:predicted RNA-binding protein associated with RNAse of E/G family